MKNLLLPLCFLFAACGSHTDHSHHTHATEKNGHNHTHNQHNHAEHEHVHFDAGLAEELGADDYGMRQYVIAFLKTGEQQVPNEEEANKKQIAHLKNIQRLADEGFLVMAGPFIGDSDLRGLYVFDVETVEEAEELTASDPLIQEGLLKMELHPWYGSAALKKVNEIHDQIQNVNISTE